MSTPRPNRSWCPPPRNRRTARCAPFVQWRELLDVADEPGAHPSANGFVDLSPVRVAADEHLRARVTAPTEELDQGAVNDLVHAYADRAGIDTTGLSAFSLRRNERAHP
ncbi:hypothetical protein HDA32_005812 [Spinactinospora alkalitolerans]|uniref:Uncharacterized protein n=1 Tax=Spinactinospora alkalitolerans TaxID=687207 RepID=A0A852U5B2_9ACTN|nr:hypothetical protein [Spinactinospora alkalitolerans]NYE50692.1 hypothetical protein [Spinactinospora alkalitolerans]